MKDWNNPSPGIVVRPDVPNVGSRYSTAVAVAEGADRPTMPAAVSAVAVMPMATFNRRRRGDGEVGAGLTRCTSGEERNLTPAMSLIRRFGTTCRNERDSQFRVRLPECVASYLTLLGRQPEAMVIGPPRRFE